MIRSVLIIISIPCFLLMSCQESANSSKIIDIIPTLNEMSSVWMSRDTIDFLPSIRNFRAQAITNRDLISISWFASAPYSGGYHTGIMKIDGKPVMADQHKWSAYGVERKSESNGMQIQSSTRMVFESNGIQWKIVFQNPTSQEISFDLSQDFIGFVSRYDTHWQWWYPLPSVRSNKRETFEENFLIPFKENLFEKKDVRDYIGQPVTNQSWPSDKEIMDCSFYETVIIDDQQLIVSDRNSTARTSFSFSHNPDTIIQFNSGANVQWQVAIPAGSDFELNYVMSWADDKNEVLQNGINWIKSFNQTFRETKNHWEAKWEQLFTPNNGFWSGNFPVLETDDLLARRVYYNSPLTMLYLMHTNLPIMDRVVLTGGPSWGPSIMFFWDTTSWRTIGAITDPEMMIENLKGWLTIDIDKYYGRDYLGGRGVGNRYSANYWAIFQMLHEYLVVTGDFDLLNEVINDKTILKHMEFMAYNWQNLSKYGQPGYEDEVYKLADFGPNPRMLLEAVPTYIHTVAAFNAGYVGMMKRLSDIYQKLGDSEKADSIKEDASKMAQRVLQLYAGDGTWSSLFPNNERVEIRHTLDFHFLGRYMSDELTGEMKEEMIDFVESELLTKTWMRAQSIDDPEAENSDRPDHGPLGAYDGWPLNTMEAFYHMGYPEKAMDFYRAIYPVTLEGTWSQARELWGENKYNQNARVRIARRGMCVREAASGIGFANVMLREFFGFAPQFMEDRPLDRPNMERSIKGRMYNVNYRGKLYTITSDNKGLSMKEEIL